MGLSRTEFLRRTLTQATHRTGTVTVEHLRRFEDTFADLADEGHHAAGVDVTWLIDKSALVRLSTSTDAETWTDRIGGGLVHIAAVTLLEVGHSARTAQDLRDASNQPAERGGHIVLHLDKDFEIISSLTGQATERLR